MNIKDDKKPTTAEYNLSPIRKTYIADKKQRINGNSFESNKESKNLLQKL